MSTYLLGARVDGLQAIAKLLQTLLQQIEGVRIVKKGRTVRVHIRSPHRVTSHNDLGAFAARALGTMPKEDRNIEWWIPSNSHRGIMNRLMANPPRCASLEPNGLVFDLTEWNLRSRVALLVTLYELMRAASDPVIALQDPRTEAGSRIMMAGYHAPALQDTEAYLSAYRIAQETLKRPVQIVGFHSPPVLLGAYLSSEEASRALLNLLAELPGVRVEGDTVTMASSERLSGLLAQAGGEWPKDVIMNEGPLSHNGMELLARQMLPFIIKQKGDTIFVSAADAADVIRRVFRARGGKRIQRLVRALWPSVLHAAFEALQPADAPVFYRRDMYCWALGVAIPRPLTEDGGLGDADGPAALAGSRHHQGIPPPVAVCDCAAPPGENREAFFISPAVCSRFRRCSGPGRAIRDRARL